MAKALPVLLLLALFAGGFAGQQHQQATMVPRGVEELTELSKDVANTISESFKFCIADPVKEWNQAFNYAYNIDFVRRCLAETRGDMTRRLCTPAETKLYFTSLYDSKGGKILFLKTNINCGRSSWPSGCDPGWACSFGLNPLPSKIDTIPLRTTNCLPCCEGFFCPRGLTCMLPCPLGAYCPRATMSSTTDLCDPYGYQITLNSTSGCGGADSWADFGSTEHIFCPAGYHCPTTTSKVSCSRGHFCKLGSTTEKKCIFKGSCKENEENETSNIWGYSLLGAAGVLMLIICSRQCLLPINEPTKERSRENAISLAQQQKAAQITIHGGMPQTIVPPFDIIPSYNVQSSYIDSFRLVEPSKVESFKVESSKVESSKVKSFKVESLKVEFKVQLFKVEFKNLTLTLGKRKLLRSVTGELLPGRITAVMGPSGAGKTTFLNAIAGNIAGYKMTGSVLVNGEHGNIRSYKKIIGFVPQDDVVHGNLTVEENLRFSANCRLPATMSNGDKVLIVERVIGSLGLHGVRNSMVGTVQKRGISGGQRKRVNVGMELVTEPSLLILDEPTSGLDSSSSRLLLGALREEALKGVNICAVIHQPSYTLYNKFDDLILLAKGGLIVYHGPIKTIEQFFVPLGIKVPGRLNPPDHYIEVLEGSVKLESDINVKHLPIRWMLYKGYEVPSDIKDDLEATGETMKDWSHHFYRTTQHSEEHNSLTNLLPKPGRITPGILTQYKFYLGRVTKQRWREGGQLLGDFVILAVAAICLGKIGKLNDPTFGISGYTFTTIAVSLLCTFTALRSFSPERLQYLREKESGMSSLAYFLSRDTLDHFSTALKPMIYLSMFFFFNNPRSSFGENYIILLALVYCVTGIGYTLSICLSPGPAQLCSAVTPVVLTLLSTARTAPKILKNMSYPKWALEGFIVANAERYDGVWLINRCGLLSMFGFDINNYKLCVLVLFMYGLFFRIVAFVAMIFLKKR